MRDVKVKIQPIRMKKALEIWDSDETPLAKTAWVKGPKKPRDVLRSKEIPPEDVSLDALKRKGLVEVLEPIEIRKAEDIEKIPEDVDAILIGDSEDWFAEDSILEKLVLLNKPLLVEWDNWGYSIHGRISKLRFNKYSKAKRYFTMGADEVFSLIRALRGYRFIKTMKVLYVGDFPSHSVAVGPQISLEYLNKRFGVEFVKLTLEDYLKEIEGISDEKVEDVVKKWKERFIIRDNREKTLHIYAKTYKALKNMLRKHNANAITVDCAALPEIEYVPCLAYSLLIDEGIPCGCEADLPALFAMAMLMGVSNKPVLMGNLNENATHMDIENNVVVVNHDVLPPSLASPACKIALRDYHATAKGVTSYAELIEGLPVTLAGMHWDMDKVWVTTGKVVWTEDTTHCRVSIGVKVDNAKKVSKDAFSHHVVMSYGIYVKELRLLSELMEIEFTLI
ncbi:MAG: hypothetical protein B6U76_06885 [Desulfurococcales archaeon ex4484_217_2]|nr:MAG: hypothetical protein B6U76_06885 [Desulfurococcales archaeon ex4484_217_2]